MEGGDRVTAVCTLAATQKLVIAAQPRYGQEPAWLALISQPGHISTARLAVADCKL